MIAKYSSQVIVFKIISIASVFFFHFLLQSIIMETHSFSRNGLLKLLECCYLFCTIFKFVKFLKVVLFDDFNILNFEKFVFNKNKNT